jgi:RNA polymerase sigma factor (sigma-70 family)
MKASGSIAMSDVRQPAADEVVQKYGSRLANFIRRRVPDRLDAEDILQEVFYEFIELGEPGHPMEQIGAWLFRVARNRIIDLFRKKKPERFTDLTRDRGEEHGPSFEDLLPSPEAGPDAVYARSVLTRELADAIEDLPEDQRYVFIAHEIEGRSFKDLAAETGLGVNTLLSRKHYAVMQLRDRLEAIYREFTEG